VYRKEGLACTRV